MQVIGHRGAAAHAPENTLESFAAAVDLGVDAIETDVQQTSDGELVLIHDKTLDRTTNGKGLVRKTPWNVIKTLDAGSWFAERFRGAKVPLLRDALQQYGRRTELVLEIKRARSGVEALDMVREFELLDRVTFTSFEIKVLKKIKSREPAAKAGFISSKISDVKHALEAGVDQFCPPAKKISRSLVDQWRAMGLEVRAWGVKDEALMRAAIAAGVDGMTVDFPGVLLRALDRAPRTPQ